MAKLKSEVPAEKDSSSELVAALVTAINSTKPAEKKNQFTRKKNTPWTPKDGSPKLKLKRKLYQHGREVSETRMSNDEISLANKIRPGVFCGGFIKVTRRRDKGIDIDYRVRTNSDHMKLVSEYGVRSLTDLLQLCIDQANLPKAPEFDEDGDAN